MKQLPIIQIFRHAVTMPFTTPGPFLKAVGLLVGLFVLFGILIYAMGGGELMEAFARVAQHGTENPEVIAEDAQKLVPLMLLSPVFLVLVFMASAHLFNVSVRVGAYGPEGSSFSSFSQALGAAGINALKFLGIGLLLMLISVVVVLIFGVIGIGPSLAEQGAANAGGDIAEITRASLMSNIIVLLVSCGAYSYFSANLTQSALKSDSEGLTHPHVMDFAIVLILLYAIVLVPTTLAGLMGSAALMYGLQVLLGVFVSLAVGAAHGIRYRICVAENEQKVFE